MVSATTKRFDHYFRQFEQEGSLLQRHVEKGIKELRLAKATAYRMACAYIEMEKHWHNELLDMITGMGSTVDEWTAQWFQPITALGEDWSNLVAAIQRGMTREQYECTMPRVFIARHQRADKAERDVAGGTPREPSESLTLEDAMKQWRSRAKALELQLREEHRKRVELEREVVGLKKIVTRLRKTLEVPIPA